MHNKSCSSGFHKSIVMKMKKNRENWGNLQRRKRNGWMIVKIGWVLVCLPTSRTFAYAHISKDRQMVFRWDQRSRHCCVYYHSFFFIFFILLLTVEMSLNVFIDIIVLSCRSSLFSERSMWTIKTRFNHFFSLSLSIFCLAQADDLLFMDWLIESRRKGIALRRNFAIRQKETSNTKEKLGQANTQTSKKFKQQKKMKWAILLVPFLHLTDLSLLEYLRLRL